MLHMLPQVLQQFTQAQVSVGRLQEFLAADELDERPPLPAAASGTLVYQGW